MTAEQLDLGNCVKKLREHMGESQTIFGKRVGVSGVTVGRWEGGAPPRGVVLMELAREADKVERPDLGDEFRDAYEKGLRGRNPSARAIKAIRAARGWTQQELAAAAKISPASVVRYEGNGIPDRAIIERLAALAAQSGLVEEAGILRRQTLIEDTTAFLATADDFFVGAFSEMLASLKQNQEWRRQRAEAFAEPDIKGTAVESETLSGGVRAVPARYMTLTEGSGRQPRQASLPKLESALPRIESPLEEELSPESKIALLREENEYLRAALAIYDSEGPSAAVQMQLSELVTARSEKLRRQFAEANQVLEGERAGAQVVPLRHMRIRPLSPAQLEAATALAFGATTAKEDLENKEADPAESGGAKKKR